MRIAWLGRQPAADLAGRFKPQPWEQVIKVLRESGHANAATRIAIRMQWRRRSGPLHWLYGVLYGFGHRPQQFLLALIPAVAVLIWVLLYAGRVGVMVPTDLKVQADEKYAGCRANWTTCEQLKPYPAFNPYLYSAELLLPAIDLQQVRNWWPSTDRPDGWWINVVAMACKLVGWIAVGVFTAVVSGLIRKD
jgi:hypothetical protein